MWVTEQRAADTVRVRVVKENPERIERKTNPKDPERHFLSCRLFFVGCKLFLVWAVLCLRSREKYARARARAREACVRACTPTDECPPSRQIGLGRGIRSHRLLLQLQEFIC